MRKISTALALMALAVSGPLSAHDFWIEPTTFRPEVGAAIGLRLMVGQGFRGEALPRNPALIEKFVLVSGGGETEIPGRPADDPAGVVRIAAPGLQIVGYRSRNSSVSLEAEKFENYLREEGLDAIVAERARRGDSQKPSRELFSRCAKALLLAASGTTGYDRILGFTLELIPETNPYALRSGDELPVRLLFEGKPLPGALVVALPYATPGEKIAKRTDRDGRVRLRLPYGGVWLLKAVHMVPAPSGGDADWQSLWASLTLESPVPFPVSKAP